MYTFQVYSQKTVRDLKNTNLKLKSVSGEYSKVTAWNEKISFKMIFFSTIMTKSPYLVHLSLLEKLANREILQFIF